jgi:peptide/nickel transport system substrate-binding protein
VGQGVKNSLTVCRTPPGPRKDLNRHYKPRTAIMAVSLTFILTSTVLFGLQPGLIPAQILLAPPDTDTLVYTTSEGSFSLEPTRGNPWIVSSFYDTLVSYERERTDRFRPILVTEVPSLENERISPDGLTYRFTIRNDSPLTPEDVEYSIERAMIRGIMSDAIDSLRKVLLGEGAFQTYCNRTGGYYNVTVDFEDIDNAVDAEGNDVMFHLAKVYPPFMHVLASSGCSILSKAWCVSHGDWPGTEEAWKDYISPIHLWSDPPLNSPLDSATQGLGPFLLERTGLESWRPWIFLVRNDNYWRGPARLEKVVIRWNDDWGTSKKMIIAGDADVCSVPKENYAELAEVEGIRVYTGLPAMKYSRLCFNFVASNNSPLIGSGVLDGNGVPPDFFSDIDIRKAFAYSIDYDTIIKEIYECEAQKVASPFLEGFPFHNPDLECYTYDLDMARQHLQQAWGGELWNTGFNATLVYITPPGLDGLPPSDFDFGVIAEMLKSNIEAINANFKVNILQEQDVVTDWNDTSFYIYDDYNYLNVLGMLEGFDTYARGKYFFNGHYDYNLDSQIEATRNTVDPVERQVIYNDLQRIYHEDVLGITFVQLLTRHYQRDWVWGWYYNPAAAGMDFYEMLKGTYQDATRNIIAYVTNLVNSRVMGTGAGSSLIETLDRATDFMDKGSLTEASQKLDDFTDQVNALELPVWDKGELTALAQEVIEVLTSSPGPTDGGFEMTMIPVVGGGVAAFVVIVLIAYIEGDEN